MELIQNNPYRIAGILSNSTLKELERNKVKFLKYVEVKKQPKSEIDFESIIGGVIRTKENLHRAFSNIEQNQGRVNHSLFWFLGTSPFDNTAIAYLKNGDEEKAAEIWGKVTNNKEVNSNNFSAFNNIGTLQLLSTYKVEVKKGIEAKLKLIESEHFESFVYSVADETYTIDRQKQSEKLIDELLVQFNKKYSSSETMQLFSGCNGAAQQYLSKKFTEEPLHNITSNVEATKKKRSQNKREAYEYGLRLYVSSKDDLERLKSLLGVNDLKYKMIADNVAKEVMQCSIDYFNESQEINSSKNYLEDAVKLVKLADSIAVSKLVKDRVKDNLASLAEMKDGEINQAIQVLQSIKDTYKANERDIHRMISEKGIPLERIDISKVIHMIKNSIDWDKATELLVNVIPRGNLNKIKSVQNISKISEYKELVEFVLDKVSYSYKSRIQYLKYWQTAQKPQRTTTTASNRKTSSNDDNEGCAPWVYVVGIIIVIIVMINACS